MLCTMCMHGIDAKRVFVCVRCGAKCCRHTISNNSPPVWPVCYACRDEENEKGPKDASNGGNY